MESETAGPPSPRGRPKHSLSDLSEQMMAYLTEMLKDGPMASNEVRTRVAERFGERALENMKRARTRAGVRAVRRGFGKGGHWEMQLPPTRPQKCRL